MRFIALIMLILSILCIFSSCNDEKPADVSSKRKARLVKLYYNNLSDRYYVNGDSIITVRFIDTMYNTGDIIELVGDHYRIIN